MSSVLRALVKGHLPEMDGYELARRLRADPANSAALFIALTGYGQAHDRILSKSSGSEPGWGRCWGRCADAR